ncbi:MAG: hypothetical protein LBT39_06545 [Treponema sp.]|jgi:hypothetical protein|nr:hypothetical protein [Treponema sp.]
MIQKKKYGIPLVLSLGMIFLLASCADFFTTSWGLAAARDTSKIEVNADNIKQLLRDANGDKKTSKVILGKIADKLESNTNPNSEPELRVATVKAANQASGLGQLVLGEIDKVLADGADEDALNALVDAIQDGAKENKLGEIAEDVGRSLLPVTTGTKPVFAGDFIDDVSTSDLTLLAVTLILAESGGDFEAYIESWSDGTKKLDGTGAVLNSNERLIAAIANELAGRDGELSKMLSDLLEAD